MFQQNQISGRKLHAPPGRRKLKSSVSAKVETRRKTGLQRRSSFCHDFPIVFQDDLGVQEGQFIHIGEDVELLC